MLPGLFDDIDDLLEHSNSHPSNNTTNNDNNNFVEDWRFRSSIPDIEPDVLDKVDEYLRTRDDLFTDESANNQIDTPNQFEFIPNTNRIEYNQPECVICSDDLVSPANVSIGHLDICNHIFCFKCIHAWANRTNICPLCKRKFGHIRKLSRSDLTVDGSKISFIHNCGDVVLVDDKSLVSPRTQNIQETGCELCGHDDNWDMMLLCDECDNGFHIYCLNPPLSNIPPGLWFCPGCTININSNLPRNSRQTEPNSFINNGNTAQGNSRNERLRRRLSESDSFSDYIPVSNINNDVDDVDDVDVDFSDFSNTSLLSHINRGSTRSSTAFSSSSSTRPKTRSSGAGAGGNGSGNNSFHGSSDDNMDSASRCNNRRKRGNERHRGRPKRSSESNSESSNSASVNSNGTNESNVNGNEGKVRKSRSDKGKKRKNNNLTPIQALGRSFRLSAAENIANNDPISAMFNRERVLTSRLSVLGNDRERNRANVPSVLNTTESRLLRFMNYEYQKNSMWS